MHLQVHRRSFTCLGKTALEVVPFGLIEASGFQIRDYSPANVRPNVDRGKSESIDKVPVCDVTARLANTPGTKLAATSCQTNLNTRVSD